jgi:D-arabinose 1-dehydrogenase-like Zn-dependent alcohol dehydrogenase
MSLSWTRSLVLRQVTVRSWFGSVLRALDRRTWHLMTGKPCPSIDRAVALDQVADAMRMLAAGQVRGRVVITV